MTAFAASALQAVQPLPAGQAEFWWRASDRHGVLQPSGARLVFTDNIVVKTAEGVAAAKLRRQADWIVHSQACGLRHAPALLGAIGRAPDGFGYLMPRYRPAGTSTSLAEEALAALAKVWALPNTGLPQPDPDGYVEAVAGLLRAFCPELAVRLIRAGERVPWPADRRPVFIHGDATFENMVRGDDGHLILLDANPQGMRAVHIAEQDVAKVALSVSGWEPFVRGDCDLIMPDATFPAQHRSERRSFARALVLWLGAAHLARTLPYGAKRGDSRLALPSIAAWLEACEKALREA